MVRGALLAIDRGGTGTYHFFVDSQATVADVVRMVCGLMGQDFERATRTAGERQGQDAVYRLDCSRAEEEFDWSTDFKRIGDEHSNQAAP